MNNYSFLLSFILSIFFLRAESFAQVTEWRNIINDNSPDSFISRINCNANNDLWSYFACESKAVDTVNNQNFDSVNINIEIARLPYPFVTSHKLFVVSIYKAGNDLQKNLQDCLVVNDSTFSAISFETNLEIDDFISRFKNK